MDKDGRLMCARFIRDQDEALLTVLADDVHDHVSGQRGPRSESPCTPHVGSAFPWLGDPPAAADAST
jgi:hypothetical protein